RRILAGRDEAKLRSVGDELGCPIRPFDLSGVGATAAHLDGAALVLNCAGPFYRTAKPLTEACLTAGVHYLDMTVQIDVIEHAVWQPISRLKVPFAPARAGRCAFPRATWLRPTTRPVSPTSRPTRRYPSRCCGCAGYSDCRSFLPFPPCANS